MLEGRLYPAASVVATSRPVPAVIGHRSFHKRIVIHGLDLSHVESFARCYFATSAASCDALIQLMQTNPRLMKLASNPMMCILLCLVFEEQNSWLPDSASELFTHLMKFVMSRSLQQSQVSFLINWSNFIRTRLFSLYSFLFFF